MAVSLHSSLSGEQAFYKQKDYLALSKKDLAAKETLAPSYYYSEESKVFRVAKNVFSLLCLPIGVCRLLHRLVGLIVVISSGKSLFSARRELCHSFRQQFFEHTSYVSFANWKVKRLCIDVEGTKIDAVILGKPSTLGNGRWLLASNGNGECYEDRLYAFHAFKNYSFEPILSSLDSNLLLFNYPGVGDSSGLPSRTMLAKTYRAMLAFLADKEKGIGAKEVIAYNHSIGGAVEAEAMLGHDVPEGVKYLSIKSRTFSDLNTTVSELLNRVLAALVSAFGWNMSTVRSSVERKHPEIVLQSVKSNKPGLLQKVEDIGRDRVIKQKATLARALLESKQAFRGDKKLLGIPLGHNDGLDHSSRKKLVDLVQSYLNQ